MELRERGANTTALKAGIASYEQIKARIAEKAPSSLDDLAKLSGWRKSNLSRTLKKMESYGLLRLEREERGRAADAHAAGAE